MFWTVLSLAGMGVLLFKLGAMSAWVQLQRLALLAACGAAALGAVAYLGRRLHRSA
jgi:hypothetical protein